MKVPENIKETIEWPLKKKGIWSKSEKDSFYIYEEEKENIRINAKITYNWDKNVGRYFADTSAELRVNKYNVKTLQIEENLYNFKLSNVMNNSLKYEKKEDRDRYSKEKVLEIISNMNSILSTIPFIN